MSGTDTAAPRYLSIPQLARRMGCAHSTLYADIRAGRFPFPVVQVGADKRVPLEAVEAFERGDTTDAAKLAARVIAMEARLDAHEARERAVGAALVATYSATPAEAGAVPAALPTIPPMSRDGSNLEERREHKGEYGEMVPIGVPQRARGGRRTGRADGGHRGQTAQRDGRSHHRVAAGSAD